MVQRRQWLARGVVAAGIVGAIATLKA